MWPSDHYVDRGGGMRIRTTGDLGALIRHRRLELTLDQRGLADRIGVSREWIIDIEKGKPRAEIGLVLRALKALDLDVDVTVETARPKERSPGSRRKTDVDA